MKSSVREETLHQFQLHRQRWVEKGLLRQVYKNDFYRPMAELTHKLPKPWVEIGSGPCLMQASLPERVATDIVPGPGIQACLDATQLPFKSNSIGALLLLDVIHHLDHPWAFLQEAERVLLPGGCLILVEPWLTPISRFIYKYFHAEACDEMIQLPTAQAVLPSEKRPFEGNQAIPYLLFSPKNRSVFTKVTKKLRIVKVTPFSGLTYLASFGFQAANPVPGFLYPLLATLERITLPLWRSLASMKALIILERIP